jgi:hypothetical protein
MSWDIYRKICRLDDKGEFDKRTKGTSFEREEGITGKEEIVVLREGLF